MSAEIKPGDWVVRLVVPATPAATFPPAKGQVGFVTHLVPMKNARVVVRAFVIWGPSHEGSHWVGALRHACVVDAVAAQERFEREGILGE